ncbi:MAG TPA: hypothetical protein VMS96_11930 [Terriglobales bacterium]|nr:hypothetical protein [Terriglobales bacterium]
MLPLAHAALWLSSSSDEGKTVLYAAIGFVVGIFLFIRGFRMLQRKRLILDTPTAKVRSAAIGLVELTGLAVGPDTITSPITQRPCFYYRTAVWKEEGSGKNRHWAQKIDERFHVPFFLKDETGLVLVNPHGAELDIHCDFKAEYSRSMFSSAGVPPRVAEFAGRNGVALDDNVRVEEYCLKPRNALYILGTLATNAGLAPDPTPVPTLLPSANVSSLDFGGGRVGLASSLMNLANLRINVNVQARPTFAAPGPVPLTDFDRKMAARRAAQAPTEPAPPPAKYDPADPRAARSAAILAAADPAAAAAVATVAGTSLPQAIAQTSGAAAAQTAKPGPKPQTGMEQVAAAAEQDVFPAKCPTVICKGSNNPAFYISWRSQKEIVSELSTRSTLLIFGGPVLSALCLWYLLSYFHAM